MIRARLVVMLKEPHAGRVKTRLGRDIGMTTGRFDMPSECNQVSPVTIRRKERRRRTRIISDAGGFERVEPICDDIGQGRIGQG